MILAINQKLKAAFEALSLDITGATAIPSGKPDLSDFQCNGTLRLKDAKFAAKNVAEILAQDDFFSSVTVDGPGFINMTVADKNILSEVKFADNIASQPRQIKGFLEQDRWQTTDGNHCRPMNDVTVISGRLTPP